MPNSEKNIIKANPLKMNLIKYAYIGRNSSPEVFHCPNIKSHCLRCDPWPGVPSVSLFSGGGRQ